MEATFEHAHGLLMMARAIYAKEKVFFIVLSKKHALELKISMY